MADDYRVYSFNFIDENRKEALYWRDVGTLEAYYEANMDVAAVSPVFNLYDEHWPIRTRQRQYPPAKFVTPTERSRAANLMGTECAIKRGSPRFSTSTYARKTRKKVQFPCQ